MTVTIHQGDCRAVLDTLPDESVNTIVTSPPYWGLRSYLPEGHPQKHLEIGSEDTVDEWVETLVDVFRRARRVLRRDGVMFLNLGDSYAGDRDPKATQSDTITGKGLNKSAEAARAAKNRTESRRRDREPVPRSDHRMAGIKPKDMVGQPWMLAFALRADGWYLRQEIIWCLSGGAWVYARTRKGEMPVMVKDLVRLDPRSVQLWTGEKWTNVLGWGQSNDTSERIELVLRSGERIGCTGGHLWPTQRGNIAARDLRIGDAIATCRLPAPVNAKRPGHLIDDALWLAGLYLAEGSRSAGSARQLSLGADEAAWLPRIDAVARHYGGSSTHTIDGNVLAVRLFGRVLHAVIDAYVGGAAAIDKHLKNAVWRLPDADLRIVVQGYLDGDGHDDRDARRWRLGFCRNYSLERDLRTAASRLGATITLKPSTSAYQDGERPTFKGEWRWERSGHHNEKDRGEVVEIRASRARKFWDIAVEDEPHLFALASGVLTHNCKPNPMPESAKDRCTKAHEHVFLLTKSGSPTIWQARDTREWRSKLSQLERAEQVPWPCDDDPDRTRARWQGRDYFWNFDAIQEPASENSHARLAQDVAGQAGSTRAHAGEGRNGRPMKAMAGANTQARIDAGALHPSGWARGDGPRDSATHQTAEHHRKTSTGVGFGHGYDAKPKPRVVSGSVDGKYSEGASEAMGRGPGWRDRADLELVAGVNPKAAADSPGSRQNASFSEATSGTVVLTRNPRTVWTIPTHGFKGAHFATFPPELARRCIAAGCPPGGVVLDPFGGSGTVGLEADRAQCDAILIDLDERNTPMAQQRISDDGSLLARIEVNA